MLKQNYTDGHRTETCFFIINRANLKYTFAFTLNLCIVAFQYPRISHKMLNSVELFSCLVFGFTYLLQF